MKTMISCPRCNGKCQANISDDLMGSFKCKLCNSETAFTLAGEKFEYLFDIGLASYLSGNYRGAIFNWAGSIERVLESFVKYLIFSKNTSEKIIYTDLDYQKYWKLLESQTERQIGAFASLFMVEMGEIPNIIHQDSLKSSLRNKVIHKGYFPTQEEALLYGRDIYNLILKIFEHLNTKIGNSVINFNFETSIKRHEIMKKKYTSYDDALKLYKLLIYSAIFLNSKVYGINPYKKGNFESIDLNVDDKPPFSKSGRVKINEIRDFETRLEFFSQRILNLYNMNSG